jgi:hypothetical protein
MVSRSQLLFIGEWLAALGERPARCARETGLNEGYSAGCARVRPPSTEIIPSLICLQQRFCLTRDFANSKDAGLPHSAVALWKGKSMASTPNLRPSPLPAKIDDWERFIKNERTLNDYVEDVMRSMVSDNGFRALIEAVNDGDAVEGSLSADNFAAAAKLREKARQMDVSDVAKAKLHSVNIALSTVLRRYHKDRKRRRQSLGGRVIETDNGEQ